MILRLIRSFIAVVGLTAPVFAAPLEWGPAIDLFSDALERTRASYVDTPRDGDLLLGAVDGVIALIPKIGDAPEVATAKKRLASESISLSAGLDLFGEVVELARSNSGSHTPETVMIAAINGMVARVDRFSNGPAMTLNSAAPDHAAAIGVELKLLSGLPTVVRTYDGNPAAGALMPGDIVTSIDGKKTMPHKLEDAVVALRGVPGSRVKVSADRAGKSVQFDLTRSIVKLPSASGRLLEDVYFVHLPNFASGSSGTVRKLLSKLGPAGSTAAKGLVIDLRGNTGGLWKEVISQADVFLDEGVISRTVNREGQTVERATPGDAIIGMPIALLVDSTTASGAEVFVSALAEAKRAVVIGEQTAGKGAVATVIPLGPAHRLMITTGRLVTPSGVTIEGHGVRPDVSVQDRSITRDTDDALQVAVTKVRSMAR